MSQQGHYASPAAFRHALTDKLRVKASDSRWTLPELQRQIAYDRFLARLYLADTSWIVKGATALLARDLSLRATVDIDIYRQAALDEAEVDLRAAVDRDIGDWFRFDIGTSQPVGDGNGMRLAVSAYIGTTMWAQFHVDLVGSPLLMTGEPEEVPALAQIGMADLTQHGYLAYPLVDHVADKVAATFERYGDRKRGSTRYKDLIDLVAIVSGASIEAEAQMGALKSEADRRGIVMPTQFDVPDLDQWRRGYANEAKQIVVPKAGTLEEALKLVKPFLDPLLAGTARGIWKPAERAWRE